MKDQVPISEVHQRGLCLRVWIANGSGEKPLATLFSFRILKVPYCAKSLLQDSLPNKTFCELDQQEAFHSAGIPEETQECLILPICYKNVPCMIMPPDTVLVD